MFALLLTSLSLLSTPAPTPPIAAVAPTATVAAAAPVQVLVLELSAIDVKPEKVKLLAAQVAQSLGARGLEVLTHADLRTIADLGADKSAAGCDEGSQSCLAEVAAALGARLVVSGQVGALDDQLLLQLSLFDSQVGKAVAREEARGKTLSALADAIPSLIDRLVAPVMGAAPAPPPVVERGLSPLTLVGGGVAGVGVAACVVFTVWTISIDNTLGSASADHTAKQQAFNDGPIVAPLAIGTGVVAAAGAALLGWSLVAE